MKFIDDEGAICLEQAYSLHLSKVQAQRYVLKQIRKHYVLSVLIGYTNANCSYVRLSNRQIDWWVTCVRNAVAWLSVHVGISDEWSHNITHVLWLHNVGVNM